MIKRRNSTIEFIRINNKEVVSKKYHATYDVKEEFEKLNKLSQILNYSSRFRCVKVFNVRHDELVLEKIDSSCLESLNNSQISVLSRYKEEIINLFLLCNSMGFSFDSDLSNLFYSYKKSEFIFIDPIQEDLKIDHLSFVVFALSIIKSIGKSKNIFLLVKKIIFFKNYFRAYSAMGNIDAADLKNSFCKYIDVVIQWNNESAEKNKLLIGFVRQVFLVPIWKFIKFLIKNLSTYEAK